MRAFILALLAAAVLAGCENAPQRWPWEKTVPINKPLAKDSQSGNNSAPRPAGVVAVWPGGAGDNRPVSLSELTSQPSGAPAAGAASTQPEQPAAAPMIKSMPLTETPQVVAQSLVQVNDAFVTVDDILVGARLRFAELPAGISEVTFRKQAKTIVQEEIRDQENELLVSEEAAGKLTDAEKEEVDKEMAEAERAMIAKAGGSKVHLEQLVLAEGMTLEKMLKEHRRRVESQVFVQAKIMPSIIINPRLLWSYYQAHKEDFSTPRKVQMQTLTVRYRKFLPEGSQDPTADEIAKARKRAQEEMDQARADLKAGKPFADVAKKHSQDSHADEGGLWPLMAAGSFAVTKVEAAAFEKKEGEVSDVIEDDGNLYLVRVAKVQPGAAVSFEDAQGKIEQILTHQQYLKLSEEYYQKLVRHAVVVESEDFVQNCVERAVERFWGKNKS
jgi:parvulin-like peptidyl-prolyl isomerase